MFAKREAEWERERLARERLMAEVFAERREQLQEKVVIFPSHSSEIPKKYIKNRWMSELWLRNNN